MAVPHGFSSCGAVFEPSKKAAHADDLDLDFFFFVIRLFIAQRHVAAKLKHQPLSLGRAAVGDGSDALAERFRPGAGALLKPLADETAVEQRCKRNPEYAGDLRQHFKRGRTFATLQSAEMKLGNFEAFGGILLRDAKLRARGADVAADGDRKSVV